MTASEQPLEPAEIRKRVAVLKNRNVKKVAETNLYDNLRFLIERGQIEKQIINDKPVYRLSNSFYKSANQSMIKSIVDSTNVEDFIPRFEKTHPPLTTYVKNLEKVTDSKRTVQFFATTMDDQNWSNPIDLIVRRMLITFSDLSFMEKEGIKHLLAYAYWYGVQSFINNFGRGTLNEVIANKMYSASLVLILFVLLLNGLARLIGWRFGRMMKP